MKALCLSILALSLCVRAEAALTWAVFSDIHIGYATPTWEEGEPGSVWTWAQTNLHPSFLVLTGDITDDGDAAQWQSVTNALASSVTNLPVYAVAGNHDYSGLRLATYWGSNSFAFTQGNYAFVGYPSYYNSGHGIVLSNDLYWTTNTLASITNRTVFCFTHFGILDPNMPTGENIATGYGLEELTGAYTAASVKFHIHGHTHWCGLHTTETNGWTEVLTPSMQFSCTSTNKGAFHFYSLAGTTLTVREYMAGEPYALRSEKTFTVPAYSETEIAATASFPALRVGTIQRN